MTQLTGIDEHDYGVITVIECQDVHDRMEQQHGHSGWHNVPAEFKAVAAVILPFVISLDVLYAHASLALFCCTNINTYTREWNWR